MMKNTKTLIAISIIVTVLCVSSLLSTQPSVSATKISIGNGTKNLDIELSPPERLFTINEDGYFYPGNQKITKNLEVFNIGDLPFRLCRLNASFTDDKNLAKGLEIEVLARGNDKNDDSQLLYNGTLNNLIEGVEIFGESAISPKKSVMLQFSIWMPKTSGNEYQGLTMGMDISISAKFPPRK